MKTMPITAAEDLKKGDHIFLSGNKAYKIILRKGHGTINRETLLNEYRDITKEIEKA